MSLQANYKIIVARYSEDISWTTQFDNVFIINKGQPLNIANETFLPNVGREGHTYYKYIYDNYYDLPDYLVFLQGYPFDHSPNIINMLHAFIKKPEVNDMAYFAPPCHRVTTDYIISGIPLKEIYEKIFGNIKEIDSIFGAGAQFVIKKEVVLRNSKNFYLNIINILGYCSDPYEGHIIERLHPHIFRII